MISGGGRGQSWKIGRTESRKKIQNSNSGAAQFSNYVSCPKRLLMIKGTIIMMLQKLATLLMATFKPAERVWMISRLALPIPTCKFERSKPLDDYLKQTKADHAIKTNCHFIQRNKWYKFGSHGAICHSI